MYIIMCDIDHQSRFDAWDRVLRADTLGWPWVQDGEHMYTQGWFMSMYGKNHYSIVK